MREGGHFQSPIQPVIDSKDRPSRFRRRSSTAKYNLVLEQHSAIHLSKEHFDEKSNFRILTTNFMNDVNYHFDNKYLDAIWIFICYSSHSSAAYPYVFKKELFIKHDMLIHLRTLLPLIVGDCYFLGPKMALFSKERWGCFARRPSSDAVAPILTCDLMLGARGGTPR